MQSVLKTEFKTNRDVDASDFDCAKASFKTASLEIKNAAEADPECPDGFDPSLFDIIDRSLPNYNLGNGSVPPSNGDSARSGGPDDDFLAKFNEFRIRLEACIFSKDFDEIKVIKDQIYRFSDSMETYCAESRLLIAQTYDSLEQYEDAVENFQEVLKFNSTDQVKFQALKFLSRFELYTDPAKIESVTIDQGFDFAKQMHQLAIKIKDTGMQIDSATNLAKFYAADENFDQAYNFQKTAVELTESHASLPVQEQVKINKVLLNYAKLAGKFAENLDCAQKITRIAADFYALEMTPSAYKLYTESLIEQSEILIANKHYSHAQLLLEEYCNRNDDNLEIIGDIDDEDLKGKIYTCKIYHAALAGDYNELNTDRLDSLVFDFSDPYWINTYHQALIKLASFEGFTIEKFQKDVADLGYNTGENACFYAAVTLVCADVLANHRNNFAAAQIYYDQVAQTVSKDEFKDKFGAELKIYFLERVADSFSQITGYSEKAALTYRLCIETAIEAAQKKCTAESAKIYLNDKIFELYNSLFDHYKRNEQPFEAARAVDELSSLIDEHECDLDNKLSFALLAASYKLTVYDIEAARGFIEQAKVISDQLKADDQVGLDDISNINFTLSLLEFGLAKHQLPLDNSLVMRKAFSLYSAAGRLFGDGVNRSALLADAGFNLALAYYQIEEMIGAKTFLEQAIQLYSTDQNPLKQMESSALLSLILDDQLQAEIIALLAMALLDRVEPYSISCRAKILTFEALTKLRRFENAFELIDSAKTEAEKVLSSNPILMLDLVKAELGFYRDNFDLNNQRRVNSCIVTARLACLEAQKKSKMHNFNLSQNLGIDRVEMLLDQLLETYKLGN